MITVEQFTDRAVAAAAGLGPFFSGMSDRKMLHALQRVRSNLEASMADVFGEDVAAAFAEAFVKTVAGHRKEIGGGSTMSPVLN